MEESGWRMEDDKKNERWGEWASEESEEEEN